MFPDVNQWLSNKFLELCVLSDNNLLIVPNSVGWEMLREYSDKKEHSTQIDLELFEDLICNGYAYTDDIEGWGQLSNAPGFSDVVNEVGEDFSTFEIDVPHFWYYNNYVLNNWIDMLISRGYVIFDYFNCKEN